MRPAQVAIIGVIVVLLILVVFVLIVKPTVVLPSIAVSVPGATVIQNIMDQQNANGVDVRVRTDGKIIAEVAGKELAQVGYTPQTLGNVVSIAEKIAVPRSTSATIRLAPDLIPGLRTFLVNSALTAYYVLPVEVNLKLIP